MYNDPFEEERRRNAAVTPTGMSRSQGQQRQASRANVRNAILGPAQAVDAVSNFAQQNPKNHTQPVGPGVRYADGGSPGISLEGDQGMGRRTIAPQTQAPQRGAGQFFPTSGYDPGKIGNANSLKYLTTEALSNFDPRLLQSDPATRQAALELIHRFAPNATFSEGGKGDKLNFNGTLADLTSGVPVYEVDFGMGFGGGNPHYGWIDLVNDQMGGPPPTANDLYSQTQNSILQPQLPQQMDSNALMMLLQQMLEQQGGIPDFNEQQFL